MWVSAAVFGVMSAEIRTIQDVIDLLLDPNTPDTAARLKASAGLMALLRELVETFERSAELAEDMRSDLGNHPDDAWEKGRWHGRTEAFTEAATVVRGEQ